MRVLGTYSLRFPVSLDNGLLWSKYDDQLALLTTKSIYVYDLLVNTGNATSKMNWKLSSIPSSEEVNPWQMAMGMDRVDMIERASPKEIDVFNMDKTVSPDMESGRSTFRQFVSGEWIRFESLVTDILPSGGARRNESLLLTLTMDHWVRLYGRKMEDSSEWTLIKDISQVIHSYLKDTHWDKTSPPSLPGLQARAYGQATLAFLWIEDYKYLLLAQKNGDLIILDGSLRVIKVIKDLIDSEISSLYTIPGTDEQSFILLVCAVDGRIKGFRVEPGAASSSEWTVGLQGGDVWPEADQMRVSKILVTCQGGGASNIVIGKGSFIIFIRIESERAHVEDTISVGSTSVNGFVQCEKGLIVMSLNGPLALVNAKRELKELTDLGESLDLEHYMNKGLSTSRWGAIIALVQNVQAYYDHLVLRTPTKLVFLTQFKSSPEALQVPLDAKDFSLTGYKDYLEVGRLLFYPKCECFIQKKDIREPELLYWYLRTFKCNERRKVSDEELEEVRVQLLKAYTKDRPELEKRMNGEFLDGDSSCVICEEPFSQRHSDHLLCSNGHTFPRCVLSLKATMSTELLQCRWCRSLADPQANPLLIIHCPLCGGPFDK
eukprot:TRINITY_DN11067_c0_g1_i1.p1 TRINITY_DN11067_c0_g1~~TRINITY_DN11067_c0_g1_i1.p1  ORF type:complete len:604 (+),score=147.91 TRINITY_DN11067_c0_g1_i1:45-1856(+)